MGRGPGKPLPFGPKRLARARALTQPSAESILRKISEVKGIYYNQLLREANDIVASEQPGIPNYSIRNAAYRLAEKYNVSV